MKILYVTRKHPPSVGGMQTQSLEFFRSVSGKEEVRIISWGGSQVFLPLFMVFAFCRSAKLLARREADLVQLGDIVLSPLGLVLKKLFKRPVCAVSHGKDSAYGNFIYDTAVLGTAKKLDRIFCVSAYIKERLAAKGFDPRILEVIPNGIDTGSGDRRDMEKSRAEKMIKNSFGVDLAGKKVVLSVCRLVPKKGLKEFVRYIFPDIAERVGEAVLLIAGAGPEKNAVEKASLKAGLKDRTFFTGKVAHSSPEYEALFSSADVFVMPNVAVRGDAEGFGIVALEAGLRGVPVVAFDVDGISQAVHDGENGILVKEGDREAFAENIVSVLRGGGRGTGPLRGARGYVSSRFSWDRISDVYIESYRRLIEDKG
ncbi:MAG: glycosyltransferase [Candidatus Omnitrophica bacterium]|nr:glycosyltransferase [Candidatus Omnitrophota bacterium]